jgi:hypothetical protein
MEKYKKYTGLKPNSMFALAFFVSFVKHCNFWNSLRDYNQQIAERLNQTRTLLQYLHKQSLICQSTGLYYCKCSYSNNGMIYSSTFVVNHKHLNLIIFCLISQILYRYVFFFLNELNLIKCHSLYERFCLLLVIELIFYMTVIWYISSY